MNYRVSRQEARAAISEEEMVEEYFFVRHTYAPACLMLELTHWNQFEILDALLTVAAQETGSNEEQLTGFYYSMPFYEHHEY
jgi:hypothetical protein